MVVELGEDNQEEIGINMGTITSQFGNSPIGQQQQNFQDILRSITGGAQAPMSPQVAQQGYQSALSSALALNTNQPAFEEEARQSLTQQSGIPKLQNQQADLSKLFELYLADSGLAGKYSATPTNPYSGGAANPYTGTPDEIASAVTPTDTGAPGGGFTSPGMVTQAIGAPVSATNNIMELVQKAIGVQKGRVDKKMGDVSANYQAALSSLDTLAKVFDNAYQTAQKASSEGLGAGFEDLLKALMPGIDTEATSQPTEPKPTILPGTRGFKLNPKTLYSSPQGQWIYDLENDDWVPYVD